MSDLELLFAVLAALYVWECAWWVPRGCVALRAWIAPRFRVVPPGALLGNQRGAFVFAPPLPPLGTTLLAGEFPGIAPPRATYDELSGSGLLNEIGSASVRASVARYYAELTWIQSQLEYFRQTNASLVEAPHPGQTAAYDPTAPTLKDRFVYSADFAVIAADRAYMTRLVDQLRNQMVFQSYRRDLETQAETMCRSLAAALHQGCTAATANSVSTSDARAR